MEFEQEVFVVTVVPKSFFSKRDGKEVEFYQGTFLTKDGTTWTISCVEEAYKILKDATKQDFVITIQLRKDDKDALKMRVIKA